MVTRIQGKSKKAKGKRGNERRRPDFVLTLAFLLLPFAFAAAQPDRVSGGIVLRVSGAVRQPLALTLPDLRALPAVELSWERDGKSHHARGVDLLALIDRAGLREDQSVKNHRLRFAVVATGADGYEAVFSLGELMPSLGARGAVIAYEEDGVPLAERDAPLKLAAGGDKGPSRWVRGLTRLRVVDLNGTSRPKAPSHLGQ